MTVFLFRSSASEPLNRKPLSRSARYSESVGSWANSCGNFRGHLGT